MDRKIEVERRTCAPIENRSLPDSVCIANLVVNVWSFARKICHEEFSRPDVVEDHGSDYVLMLNIIGTSGFDPELAKDLLEGICHVL